MVLLKHCEWIALKHKSSTSICQIDKSEQLKAMFFLPSLYAQYRNSQVEGIKWQLLKLTMQIWAGDTLPLDTFVQIWKDF